MGDEQEDLEYFEDQWNSSVPEFWRRFDETPPLRGRRVLDLGCGHGALSLQMCQAGAHVLGVDLDERRIAFARARVLPRAAGGTLDFQKADVRGLAGPFDLIVSKDTFEHIDDLPSVLRALRRQLAPGGQIWAGFSPLYHSPRGDHGRTGMRIPWAHTLPRWLVYRFARRHRKVPVFSLSDIELNGMTPRQFREWVASAGLRVESVRYNAGDRLSLAVLGRLRQMPWLERFATVSIYAVISAPVRVTEE